MKDLRRYVLPWLGLILLVGLVRLWPTPPPPTAPPPGVPEPTAESDIGAAVGQEFEAEVSPDVGAANGSEGAMTPSDMEETRSVLSEAPGSVTLLDGLGQPFRTPPTGLVATVTAIGFLLIGAWLTGLIFKRINLPRVSGYLIFGVLVGPHLPMVLPGNVPALVSQSQLDYLTLVNALAISFIALTAGGEIRIDFLRKGLARIATITATEMLVVFVGVTALLLLARPMFDFLPDESTRTAVVICLLVATLAIANSPAVVIAILGETRAQGPMAQTALTMTILKDLVLIILFTVVVAISANILGAEAAEAGRAAGISELVKYLSWHLIGSILCGAVLGVVMTLVARRIGDQTPVFVLCSALGIALMSDALDFEPLLVSLAAGFMMANLWPEDSAAFFHEMERLALPVYCVFFAVAGAKVDVEAVLQFWPIALFIVAARAVMICSGTYLGARLGGLEAPARRWLWTALIPQAGVTVALIASLERSFSDYRWATALTSLLLAIVAIHELVGPLLMRFGLVRSGEVEGEGRAAAKMSNTPSSEAKR